MANVTPISRIQPATRETMIDMTMPRGPEVAADLVSSVMCADASYPVNVYWASSRPSSTTYKRELQPVLLTKWLNTYDADWWCPGAKASAPTISSTPTMCHQTLTLFSSATSRTPKEFSRPWSMRIPANSTIVCHGRVSKFHWMASSALRKNAAP